MIDSLDVLMMVGYNRRKFEVLLYVENRLSVTSQDVSIDLSLEVHCARMLLLKYYRQGLLKRTRENGQYRYELTDKGLRRLNYLLTSLPP